MGSGDGKEIYQAILQQPDPWVQHHSSPEHHVQAYPFILAIQERPLSSSSGRKRHETLVETRRTLTAVLNLCQHLPPARPENQCKVNDPQGAQDRIAAHPTARGYLVQEDD